MRLSKVKIYPFWIDMSLIDLSNDSIKIIAIKLVVTGLLKLQPQSPQSWSKEIEKIISLGITKEQNILQVLQIIDKTIAAPNNQLCKGSKNFIETRTSVSLFFSARPAGGRWYHMYAVLRLHLSQ